MSKRGRRRAATKRRVAPPGAESSPAPPSPARRWGPRVVGAVGFLGVLAGIATSVATLLPDDPPGRIAEVTSIDLQPMQLSEYEIRTARTVPVAEGSGSAVFPLLLAVGGAGPDGGGTAGDPGGETSPEPEVTPETVESPEPREDEPTPTPTVDDRAPTPEPDDDGEDISETGNSEEPGDERPTKEDTDESSDSDGDGSDGGTTGGSGELETVQEQLQLAPQAGRATEVAMERAADDVAGAALGPCDDASGVANCGLTPILAQIVGPDGRAATAEEAAREVVALLRSTRMRPTGSGRREVLGVVVDFDVRLVGFGSGGGWVAWQIYRRDGRPLPRTWRREVTVLRIRAKGHGPEQVSGSFWVPLPRPAGQYRVRVAVYDSESVRRGQRATRPFTGPATG